MIRALTASMVLTAFALSTFTAAYALRFDGGLWWMNLGAA